MPIPSEQITRDSSLRTQFSRIALQVLIAVSLLVGYLVPSYYEWTGANQSRSSPRVAQTAWGLAAVTLLIWAALPWLPVAEVVPSAERPARIRFTSRTLFLVTALIAIAMVAATKFPLFVSGGWFALALGNAVRLWTGFPQHRWQTTALLACMWCPFVWILFYPDSNQMFPAILWLATGLPAFFPAALIGNLLGQNLHDLGWLALLLTGTELAVGTSVIRLGRRRTIAYVVFVLLMSMISSFGLNSLVRA